MVDLCGGIGRVSEQSECVQGISKFLRVCSAMTHESYDNVSHVTHVRNRSVGRSGISGLSGRGEDGTVQHSVADAEKVRAPSITRS